MDTQTSTQEISTWQSMKLFFTFVAIAMAFLVIMGMAVATVYMVGSIIAGAVIGTGGFGSLIIFVFFIVYMDNKNKDLIMEQKLLEKELAKASAVEGHS